MTAEGPRPALARTLWRRVLSLLTMAMLAPLALTVWGGLRTHAEVEARLLAERALLARLVAERLANVLGTEMEALEAVLPAEVDRLPETDLGAVRTALRQVYVRRHVLFDDVFLVDATGSVRAHEPAGRPDLDGRPLLAHAQAAGRAAFSDLLGTGGARRLYALVPLRDRHGALAGVVGASIRPDGKRLRALLEGIALGPGQSIDVVDGRGTVVASTDATRLFLETDHAHVMAGAIRDGKPVSGDCHGCHAGPAHAGLATAPARVSEVLAFFPLSIVRWGVAVRQPRGAAFAAMDGLELRLLSLGTLLVVVALGFAWAATLSVTRPLQGLTRAAERIAAGDLARPIPPLAADEIGRLGASFERMRVALSASRAEQALAQERLEGRVKERTAELERQGGVLREREEGRTRALRKVLSAQEDERRRIARELHDETSQSLAALAMRLEAMAAGAGDPAAREQLEAARALAVHTLDEVHRLIVDLRPSVLDDLGLGSAIVWYAERCLEPRGVEVRCELSGLDERLPPRIETAVFRTAQEAMTNIARHAGAESVLVQCGVRDGRVTLEVEDDGQGFDAAAVRPSAADGRGFGLLGMRERIELLGGTFDLDSAPGEGTRITATLPITGGAEP